MRTLTSGSRRGRDWHDAAFGTELSAELGRAEMLPHENNPLLTQDIDDERQNRVREMADRAQKEGEKKPSLPLRTRFGILTEEKQRHRQPRGGLRNMDELRETMRQVV